MQPALVCRSACVLAGLLVLPLALSAQQPAGQAKAKTQKQYKRIHQQVLKAVVRNQLAKARQALARHVERDPKDPEHWFLTTLVECRAAKPDAARAAVRRALELGLPAERFLAGPRNLLAAIADSPELREIRAAFAHRPVHGPMLGHVTGESVKVWLRTAVESEVEVLVRPSDKPAAPPVTARGRTIARADFTAVIEVAGLQPATGYTYALRIAGGAAIRGGRFRTFEADGKPGKVRIAFGGGAGFVPQHERMWDTIGAFRPDALLLLGDNVYIDAPEMPAMQDFCYYRRQSRPEFRRLVANVPVYSIWDDHDFGVNDCWYGPDPEKPAFKPKVLDGFRRNWANPGYGTAKTRGCHYSFRIGDLWFLMLDGRYYRSDPKIDRPSMLGAAQNAWLREQVRASDGTFRMLCSPVPWVFEAKGNSRDTWNGFQSERDAIFDFLRAQATEGVVLLSADRHRTDIWKHAAGSGYAFTEFNSSRLTNQHVHKTMKKAEYSYNAKQSFGLVEFDTTKDDPTVTMQVINIDGEVMHTKVIRRSTLTSRK